MTDRRYTLHATVGEKRIDGAWGSCQYRKCMVYRVLDTETGDWIYTGTRKAEAIKVLGRLARTQLAQGRIRP